MSLAHLIDFTACVKGKWEITFADKPVMVRVCLKGNSNPWSEERGLCEFVGSSVSELM